MQISKLEFDLKISVYAPGTADGLELMLDRSAIILEQCANDPYNYSVVRDVFGLYPINCVNVKTPLFQLDAEYAGKLNMIKRTNDELVSIKLQNQGFIPAETAPDTKN